MLQRGSLRNTSKRGARHPERRAPWRAMGWAACGARPCHADHLRGGAQDVEAQAVAARGEGVPRNERHRPRRRGTVTGQRASGKLAANACTDRRSRIPSAPRSTETYPLVICWNLTNINCAVKQSALLHPVCAAPRLRAGEWANCLAAASGGEAPCSGAPAACSRSGRPAGGEVYETLAAPRSRVRWLDGDGDRYETKTGRFTAEMQFQDAKRPSNVSYVSTAVYEGERGDVNPRPPGPQPVAGRN